MKAHKVLARHKAIKNLIKKYPIEDQHDLVALLHKEHNIETNQSIVSRDLRQLGITKHKVKDKMLYELPQMDPQREILRLAISDITHNESMIIIKTMPGIADFVGDFIDAQDKIGVIGSLAGENVVFVVPASTKKIKQTFSKICAALHFKK